MAGHTPFSVKIGKLLGGDILLVVDGQDALNVLAISQPDVEPGIPESLFRQPGIGGAVLVLWIDQRKLPRRGGGRLDVIQMGGILPQQIPDGGERLLLQPPLVEVLVGLEGLAGVQGQEPDGWGGAQEVAQGAHPGLHPLGGEDGQVVRPEHKKDQLTFGGLDAVIGELGDPHELTGGLALPQLFFLFSVQFSRSLHSKYCCLRK